MNLRDTGSVAANGSSYSRFNTLPGFLGNIGEQLNNGQGDEHGDDENVESDGII